MSSAVSSLQENRPFTDRRAPSQPPLSWPATGTFESRAALMIADAFSLTIAFAIVVLLRRLVFDSPPPLHWGLWTAIASWFIARSLNGL